jgi:hypothetical protein
VFASRYPRLVISNGERLSMTKARCRGHLRGIRPLHQRLERLVVAILAAAAASRP